MWAYFCWLQISWVCRLILKTMPSCPELTPTLHSTIGLTAGSAERTPLHQWKASRGGHLHFKEDFLQVCKFLWKQSYVMTLLHLMTSNNPKMDWCNTLYFNYGHNVTFNFDYIFLSLMIILLHIRQIGLDLMFFYLMFIKHGMRLYG